ncbi:ABC-type Fe3+/spermidine/putrescine transport system ATPase subunit [Arthrobacter sp. CAN_A6]|uniref:TOBE domain-containing protein n=1 Tax=Arthrobacter sp. CAN_A6 TaxID=2787721 RepID=UPI0018C95A27
MSRGPGSPATTGRAVLSALPAVLPVVAVLGVSLTAAALQSLGLMPFIGPPDFRIEAWTGDTIELVRSSGISQHGPVAQLHYQPATLAVNRILGGLNTIHGHIIAGHHHSSFGRIPVQKDIDEGSAFLLLRQESACLVPIGQGIADGTVIRAKSLGAHTLIRVALDGGTRRETLTVEVADDPRVVAGEKVGLRLGNGHGWAVPE